MYVLPKFNNVSKAIKFKLGYGCVSRTPVISGRIVNLNYLVVRVNKSKWAGRCPWY